MRLEDALRQILLDNQIRTQEELVETLNALGHEEVSQSRVSRMLRKLGAIKAKNADGEIVYRLPKEPAPPAMDSSVETLALDIVANEAMIIIHTSPGAASLIGRIVDFRQEELMVLGTIAGDDCLMVIPKTTQQVEEVSNRLKELLYL
ncbi:MAG: arginine repressor [Legionellales bacterium]|nr:arginine repressor [Legionellales bacterium]|tara:strand:+ start:522 stop:965 length:444 start_codon:yes stop_codon:yes gene_type:complete